VSVTTPGRLRVRVKKSHILAGRRSSRCGCPVALAIKERLPDSKVVVQLDKISIDGVDYATPERAANFMGTYDYSPKKRDVPPVDFVLVKACPRCQHPEHAPGECAEKANKFALMSRRCRCSYGEGE
jgi:hypothetical protein